MVRKVDSIKVPRGARALLVGNTHEEARALVEHLATDGGRYAPVAQADGTYAVVAWEHES